MSGWRLVQVGGGALSLVMLLLLMVGTYNSTTYIVWSVLALAGLGICLYGRKADEDIKKRQRDEDFQARNPR